VTGHVLDVAWLCPCGQRIGAGETVHPWGEAWRCAACLPTPAPTPWRRKPVQANNQEEPMPRGKPGSWQHGTAAGYAHCGPPRCKDCRAWRRAYDRTRPDRGRQPRDLPRNPGTPSFANRTKPHTRYAKGTTLEELLNE
jgi:hypothetical protein